MLNNESLKKLFDIKEWKEIATITKINQFLKAYPFLGKKINEEIISNIPSFTATFREYVSELNKRRKVKFKKNNEITTLLHQLDIILSKDDVTVEERKSVIEKIRHITSDIEEVERKKADRKKRIVKGVTIAGTAIGLVATQLIKKNKR